MLDYGDGQVLIAGSEDQFTVTLTDPSGWVESSDAWVWKMLVSLRQAPTTNVLSITATSAAITTVTDTADTMTLVFDLSMANSDKLAAGVYYVEIEGTETDASATEHYYDGAAGLLPVRDVRSGG